MGFKVIIAGGSLCGLGLALTLEKAGVEWELFEKGEIAPQLGASIGLHPQSLRIFDQLGLWQDIQKVVTPLSHRQHLDGDGKCFEDSMVLKDIEDILGRPIIFMERCKALKLLYSHIQNKSKVHDHVAVQSYEETSDGVVVTTSDGASYTGSILIGADGIHSRVRSLMADQISKTNPGLAQDITEGFTSEYKAVFAVSRNGKTPESPFLPDGTVHNVYYDQFSGVAASGEPGLVFWFLFVKTPKTTTPNCPRFTDEDAEALVLEYGKHRLGPNYTFKDIWETKVKATLVPLEEGVLKQWNFGRVMLMGDSIHKVTINAGLGGNLAYEGIARFVNLLVPLLEKNPSPSSADLIELFQSYDTQHRPRAMTVCNLSGQITRYEAQDSWGLKFAARNIVPWVGDRVKANLYASFARGAPVLNFLPLPEFDVELAKKDKETVSGLLGWLKSFGGRYL